MTSYTAMSEPNIGADELSAFGNINSDNFSLYYSDDTLSGQINGVLVFGTPLETGSGITLQYRMPGQTLKSTFKVAGGKLTGTIKNVTVNITKFNGNAGTLEGTVGDISFKVAITSQTTSGEEYVNPRFDVTLPNRSFSFQLDGGQACITCSSRIIAVVLGMLKATDDL